MRRASSAAEASRDKGLEARGGGGGRRGSWGGGGERGGSEPAETLHPHPPHLHPAEALTRGRGSALQT